MQWTYYRGEKAGKSQENMINGQRAEYGKKGDMGMETEDIGKRKVKKKLWSRVRLKK